MFVRVCGGLCVMLGAATPPKWDHSLEPLFEEFSKAFVQRTAVEKGIELHVQTCNLARSNVQTTYSCPLFQDTSIVYTTFVYTTFVCTILVKGLNDEEHHVEC